MKRTSTFGVLAAALLIACCGSHEVSARSAKVTPAVSATYNRTLARARYKRPSSIPFPADNQFSQNRSLLGKTLFFDPRLSETGSISCATCHNPGFSWGDGLPKGIGLGTKELPRRTPTLLNLAWADLLFWDGRSETLETQALAPIVAAAEMNCSLAEMLHRVTAIPGYRVMFAQAYPSEPVSAETVARAIATFERTIVSGKSPFDEWVAGRESAISENAKAGFDLFNTKAACQKCHDGWNFTDNGFHDIGVDDADLGRGAELPLAAMQHAFKTPTLRNADQRGPFMHNGSERSLEDVVELYDRGGRAKRPSLAEEVIPLHLTACEKSDLLTFLKTLTSNDKGLDIPFLPR